MLLLERWSISLIQHRNFCIPKIEGREAKGHHKAGGANSAPSHCECCVVTDALIQGKSSCHGPVYEQPGADAEGPAQHLIPDYCRQRLPRARTIALWGRIMRLSCRGDSHVPKELSGGIWQLRCFSHLLLVCITAKRQHKVEKAHVFRVLTAYTVCHARQHNYFPFLKKRFPWASLNSQLQTDWQLGVDERSTLHHNTVTTI